VLVCQKTNWLDFSRRAFSSTLIGFSMVEVPDLALHIARGMVEQHGGTIRAESEGLKQGTAFVIGLPLCSCPVEGIMEQDKSLAATASSSWDADLEQSLRRILVAEDAVSSRKMLIRLLTRAGHSCVRRSFAKPLSIDQLKKYLKKHSCSKCSYSSKDRNCPPPSSMYDVLTSNRELQHIFCCPIVYVCMQEILLCF